MVVGHSNLEKIDAEVRRRGFLEISFRFVDKAWNALDIFSGELRASGGSAPESALLTHRGLMPDSVGSVPEWVGTLKGSCGSTAAARHIFKVLLIKETILLLGRTRLDRIWTKSIPRPKDGGLGVVRAGNYVEDDSVRAMPVDVGHPTEGSFCRMSYTILSQSTRFAAFCTATRFLCEPCGSAEFEEAALVVEFQETSIGMPAGQTMTDPADPEKRECLRVEQVKWFDLLEDRREQDGHIVCYTYCMAHERCPK